MAAIAPKFFKEAGQEIGLVSQKATAPPTVVEGPYPELAIQVRRIIGEGTSTRQAALRGGVSHDTIARMLNGYRPLEHTLDRFSEGYRIDPNILRRAARFFDRASAVHDSDSAEEEKEGEEVQIAGGMRARVTRQGRPGAEVEITEEVLTILEALSEMQRKG
jgi:hypothetical protein